MFGRLDLAYVYVSVHILSHKVCFVDGLIPKRKKPFSAAGHGVLLRVGLRPP